MKQFKNPESVHSPLAAYTHQIEITEPKRWLVLSGQIGIIGTATGRFEGNIEMKKRYIEGRALISFAPYKPGKENLLIRVVGLKARLKPIRVVNFIQMVDGVAVGGITVNLVIK